MTISNWDSLHSTTIFRLGSKCLCYQSFYHSPPPHLGYHRPLLFRRIENPRHVTVLKAKEGNRCLRASLALIPSTSSWGLSLLCPVGSQRTFLLLRFSFVKMSSSAEPQADRAIQTKVRPRAYSTLDSDLLYPCWMRWSRHETCLLELQSLSLGWLQR